MGLTLVCPGYITYYVPTVSGAKYVGVAFPATATANVKFAWQCLVDINVDNQVSSLYNAANLQSNACPKGRSRSWSVGIDAFRAPNAGRPDSGRPG
eukprot:353404-Chlamydomonas_euryale.AAC.3